MSDDEILKRVDHRLWPLPAHPWVMAQTWHDLLFAHWPLSPEVLRPLVPEILPLDTFHGRAWLAVTPFHMSGVRLRYLPAVPGLSSFPELNVRTYVAYDGKPGVFFFSLDAASLATVMGARLWYGLPYFYARMHARTGKNEICYTSKRLQGPASAEFEGAYRPTSPVRRAEVRTLEYWLVERYCLYTVDQGRIYRADIHHLPWPLQEAEADIEKNTMAAASRIALPRVRPLLHFARELKVYVWAPEKVKR